MNGPIYLKSGAKAFAVNVDLYPQVEEMLMRDGEYDDRHRIHSPLFIAIANEIAFLSADYDKAPIARSLEYLAETFIEKDWSWFNERLQMFLGQEGFGNLDSEVE